MHAPGTTVRIAHDKYREDGDRDFTGQTGTVRTANERGVSITGLGPDNDQPYWFFNDEVEPA